MSEFSKKERRQLRELAGEAYSRELSKTLAELEKSFTLWRDGAVNAFELSDRIHQFHDGPNRELWKRYEDLDAKVAVASAVASGILERDELPPDLLAKMERTIDFFEEQSET